MIFLYQPTATCPLTHACLLLLLLFWQQVVYLLLKELQSKLQLKHATSTNVWFPHGAESGFDPHDVPDPLTYEQASKLACAVTVAWHSLLLVRVCVCVQVGQLFQLHAWCNATYH